MRDDKPGIVRKSFLAPEDQAALDQQRRKGRDIAGDVAFLRGTVGVSNEARACVERLKDALDEALFVLRMVDTNNRIREGDDKNVATGRARKAWDGKFVAAEVRRVLAAAGSTGATVE